MGDPSKNPIGVPLARVDLDREIENLHSGLATEERVSRPVAQLPGLRLLLVSMREGAHWAEHATAGRITVQPLTGQIRMRAAGTDVPLGVGQVGAFGANVAHDVFAITDAVFLLTVARPELD